MNLLSGHLRTIRLAKVLPFVGGEVLDLGCGHAKIKELRRDRIRRYVGVERSAPLVEVLRRRHPEGAFVRRDLDTEELDVDGQFDVVLMVALIEHLFNQKHVFDQVLQYLKPAGRIVITTPTPFGNDFVHRIGAACGLFARSAVDDHIVIYNRKRFDIVAKEFDLVVTHYRRFEFGCNQIAVLERDFGLLDVFEPGEEAAMLADVDRLTVAADVPSEWQAGRNAMLAVWRNPTDVYRQELRRFVQPTAAIRAQCGS